MKFNVLAELLAIFENRNLNLFVMNEIWRRLLKILNDFYFNVRILGLKVFSAHLVALWRKLVFYDQIVVSIEHFTCF